MTYHGALIGGGSHPRLGRRFLDFVAGAEARPIAERHGFEAPPP